MVYTICFCALTTELWLVILTYAVEGIWPRVHLGVCPVCLLKNWTNAEELTLYIYVIPHTLPRENTTRDIAPLNMSLIVEHGTTQVLKRWVEINPWSGENVEINIKGD